MTEHKKRKKKMFAVFLKSFKKFPAAIKQSFSNISVRPILVNLLIPFSAFVLGLYFQTKSIFSRLSK